jgi:FeS assembly SUF system regulator, gammaproteobacterial
MIRINRETDYAVVILCLLAEDPERRYNAAWLAERRRLPLPVVSKILKQLARAGLLISYRGAKGGYGLARPPEDISVAEIVAAIEGPISLTHCVDTGPVACEYHDGCVVSSNWNRINQVVQNALQGISLKDMIQPLNPVPQEAFVPLSTLKNLGA